jgi:hypothetical protein
MQTLTTKHAKVKAAIHFSSTRVKGICTQQKLKTTLPLIILTIMPPAVIKNVDLFIISSEGWCSSPNYLEKLLT